MTYWGIVYVHLRDHKREAGGALPCQAGAPPASRL